MIRKEADNNKYQQIGFQHYVDGDFVMNQKYLSGELNEILNGKAKFMELDEVEQRLENIISKNENCI